VLQTRSYFDVLQLPTPTWDALGRSSWPHADAVGPAFRRLSFALHPDRASHDDAPRAFQILKRAKATLEDAVEREKYVNRYVEDQRSLPEHSVWAGQGSASDRVQAQVERDALVRSLRRDEARDRQNQILEQARRRRLLAESKAGAALAIKRRRQREDEAAADDGDDDCGDGAEPSRGGARARLATDAGPARAEGGHDARSPADASALARPKAKAARTPFRKAFL